MTARTPQMGLLLCGSRARHGFGVKENTVSNVIWCGKSLNESKISRLAMINTTGINGRKSSCLCNAINEIILSPSGEVLTDSEKLVEFVL
jgi:hypothetical protein